MEILTLLATGVTIILGGALARVGELVLDGSLEKLTNLIAVKSPDTLKKLQSANQNPALLSETIEVMAILLEDPEIQKVAEQVFKENQSNPYVINMMKNVGIVNQGTIHNPTFNFN
jgi:Mor family transcriptional regulator